VSGQRHAPAAPYTLERTTVPIGQEAGLDTEAREKILCLYRTHKLFFSIIFISYCGQILERKSPITTITIVTSNIFLKNICKRDRNTSY
jgi:hypothetical protein